MSAAAPQARHGRGLTTGDASGNEGGRTGAAPPGQESAPAAVVVRRNSALGVPLAAASSAVAIAYLGRAIGSGSVLDWSMCGILALVATAYLVSVVDGRTPLLVADDLGIRIRLGAQWRGLPWEAVERVTVTPRRGPLRDGRLVVSPRSLGRALDGIDARARRQATVNRRLHGAALAVPLGVVTRVSASADGDLADRIAHLAAGRADVVTLPTPTTSATTSATTSSTGPSTGPPTTGAEPPVTGGSHPDLPTRATDPAQPSDHTDAPTTPAAVPLRAGRRGLRADLVVSSAPAAEPPASPGGTVQPGERPLRRPGNVELAFEPVPETNVRPIARPGEAVDPLVIDDFETHPAYDPVIGPELVAARHRLGLSVDQLADRTRIRPHVIEAIEVDDFAPCGGDVYARGHLRTLARVLGKDPEPLLAAYDDRYASGPVSARRVFEAELATGMTGSMRSTTGGPNWSLLVGVVLSLVLVWAVLRLLAGEPETRVADTPALPADYSGRVYDVPARETGTRPVRLSLVALNAPTRIRVTDSGSTVRFVGSLVLGERKVVRVSPPVTVWAADGGAITVTVAGKDQGLLGEPDRPVSRVFGAAAG